MVHNASETPFRRKLENFPRTVAGSRQAAYDIKRLRGKQWVQRKGNSRRYEPLPVALRAMAALIVIRDDAIERLLAARCGLQRMFTPADECFPRLKPLVIQVLFAVMAVSGA
jgi:hypothetical protein